MLGVNMFLRLGLFSGENVSACAHLQGAGVWWSQIRMAAPRVTVSMNPSRAPPSRTCSECVCVCVCVCVCACVPCVYGGECGSQGLRGCPPSVCMWVSGITYGLGLAGGRGGGGGCVACAFIIFGLFSGENVSACAHLQGAGVWWSQIRMAAPRVTVLKNQSPALPNRTCSECVCARVCVCSER